uniref:tryptophan synthase n=1 Tax=Eutreptiella gymnastica TaxID=73025 RepID=A0A7S1J6K8_9EUGL|mmetsp:Transcript_72043/g.126965  ORF Transcript_72043/g.126965 Transcript_72043/m.126965 type:complete len:101 (+) Transcript_72043:1-303(+)
MGSSFMYCTTVTGVTGARDFLKKYFETEYGQVFATFKERSKTPCIVGFGVSNNEAVGMIKSILKADGVVVGSAFMKILNDDPVPVLTAAIVTFLKDLFAL